MPSKCTETFKLCQTCRHGKVISFMTSSWILRGLDTIYRPDTKWGPDVIFQVLQVVVLTKFARLVDIEK